MKVKALTAIAGDPRSRQYGEVFDASEKEARALIASGAVEAVSEQEQPEHEEAERAGKPTGRRKS
jgi:hypothetical protein